MAEKKAIELKNYALSVRWNPYTKEYYAVKLYAWYNTINFANWDAISEIARNEHIKIEWNAKHPVEAQFTLFGTICCNNDT